VRNLAQRSAGAAKEIKLLIDDSVSQVANGSKQVADAGQTMDEIVASVASVTDIIAEIMTASVEQSLGIEQINAAVAQMDNVTQQNAALVEEATAAAASLSEQAAGLSNVVSVFRLREVQVHRAAPSARHAGGKPTAAPTPRAALAAPQAEQSEAI
jgi:methyl-accepting chemotaxis protein